MSLLSSTNVKSVQLITNPGAEYDAETRSVINITTVHHSLDGLSGIVGAEISKHKNLSNNEEVNLNIHKGALDVFLAYQYDNTRSDIRYDVSSITSKIHCMRFLLLNIPTALTLMTIMLV